MAAAAPEPGDRCATSEGGDETRAEIAARDTEPPARGEGPPGAIDRSEMLRWIGAVAGAGALVLGLGLVAPHVPLSGTVGSIVAGVFAFAGVSAEVLFVAGRAPAARFSAMSWALLPVAVLVGVALVPEAPRLLTAPLVTMGLLAFGTFVGGIVGRAIDHPGHLLVVAGVSAMVDVFSVLHPSGPTHALLEVQEAISILVLPFPLLGTDRIEPILGVGDVAFAGIYFGATRRHGLSVIRTTVALSVGLAVTLLVVIVTERGIPALPFLGAAMVLAHREARAVPKKDRRAAALGMLGMALLFAALFYLRGGAPDDESSGADPPQPAGEVSAPVGSLPARGQPRAHRDRVLCLARRG